MDRVSLGGATDALTGLSARSHRMSVGFIRATKPALIGSPCGGAQGKNP